MSMLDVFERCLFGLMSVAAMACAIGLVCVLVGRLIGTD